VQVPEELEKYVAYFKKKTDLSDLDIDNINKILNSDKYSEFIDFVYDYYNSKVSPNNPNKERLSIECYLDVDGTINNFWHMLLGVEQYEKFKSKLGIKI
jgi:hypothetical protein